MNSLVAYLPPPPSVEDEEESLAREVAGSIRRQNDDYDAIQTPRKGSVDQSPILIPLDAAPGEHSRDRGNSRSGYADAPSDSWTSRSQETNLVRRRSVNRVRFADSVQEHARMESRQSSSSRSSDSRRQVAEHVNRNSPPEATRPRLVESSSNPENLGRERRRSCMRAPRETPNVADLDTNRRLEWYSDDEISASHRGPSWNDPPTHTLRAKKVVGYGASDENPFSTGISRDPSPRSHLDSQSRADRSRYFDDDLRQEPASMSIPTAREERSMEVRSIDGKHRDRNRTSDAISVSNRGYGRSDYDSHVTSRMIPKSPSPYAEEAYAAQPRVPARIPERQCTDPPARVSQMQTRARSSTAPAGAAPFVQTPSYDKNLAPCRRSIPMEVDHPWYTISALTHLDICPSCMSQIARSRFSSLLIRSERKLSGSVVRCSFSQPWVRLAWSQTIKLEFNHLELVYQVTRPTVDGESFTGCSSSRETWYRVADPETGDALPYFNACTSCFRKLQILMPSVRSGFVSQSVSRKTVCDLWSHDPRFMQYINLLDSATTRSLHEPDGYLDLRDFIRYAKRKNGIDECPRDHLVVSRWHYIPELPEFTICEDCYDDVVWPVSRQLIANKVSRTLQHLPDSRVKHEGEHATCQLYSPKMRAIFQESVRHGDFSYLKAAVLERYDAELSFRERKMVLLKEVARGYDHDAALRRNADLWKHNE